MDMSKVIDWIGNLLSHVPFSFAKGNNNVFIVLYSYECYGCCLLKFVDCDDNFTFVKKFYGEILQNLLGCFFLG
jgi:hypothetical protein